MFIHVRLLFWQWRLYIPLSVGRGVRTPLGCTVIARLMLLALGIFCIDVPQRWLTSENLPSHASPVLLVIALHYVGIIMVIIALISLLLMLVKVILVIAWRSP
jgi:hypothetical protein